MKEARMARSDYIFSLLLGFAYILLIVLLISRTMTWGDPISGNDFWGQSSATAIAYMQIYHSVGVGFAAIPIGLVIVWRYKANWLRPAAIVAVIASSYMLFVLARAVWSTSQHEVLLSTSHIVSGAIDVAKVGLILLVVTAMLKYVFVTRRVPA